MVEPVIVWNNYDGSLHGYEGTTPSAVTIPDALWDSWPDSTYYPGYKLWFGQMSYTYFDSGPFIPTGYLEFSNNGAGGPFTIIGGLLPTSHYGTLPVRDFGGDGIINSQSVAFRIRGQGGDGQLYVWQGLTLILTEPRPGTPGYLPPPPPPVIVPVPVVHAMVIGTLVAYADPRISRRGRSFASVV